MPNYAEYFEKVCYKPTWFIGDRVSGKYKKIPFIGTVGNDTLISELEGPRVSVMLDLPIKVDNEYRSIIIVKPKELKRLLSLEDNESHSKQDDIRTSETVPKKSSRTSKKTT